MIKGLETGAETLARIADFFRRGPLCSTGLAEAERLISDLRERGRRDQAPFLIGLAEALEDGMINASVVQEAADVAAE